MSYRQLRQYRNSLSYEEWWESKPPTLSTDESVYNLGDVVWSTAPANNGPIGWICTVAGQTGATATFLPFGFIGGVFAAFNTSASTVGFTATAAQISGGTSSVDLALTGTLTGGTAITLPTVAALLAALPAMVPGQSWRLRIINESSANDAWTVTTNTGWTLTGTMTIAQNTWREFVLTITSVASATATLQSVAVGTYS
jgi:hypothetical protein